ncbi:phosphoglucan, water dikinase, chloroplastic-like [Humulus lupulus]|uniref:phosphoglucan, water dikinase, chloroplastic-like n=1 Tax=Humulus lupulus TaxID=3486 RepID=UPI002B415A8E|nr:phosphoglucan, water dikinase, chloroplastic-like [Humulus lupulus]
MRSNEHRDRESERRWDTSGLEGLALKFVEGDRNARNWWRKLEIVRDLLLENSQSEERLDALIYAAIYLKVKKKGDKDERKLKRRMTNPMDSVFLFINGL